MINILYLWNIICYLWQLLYCIIGTASPARAADKWLTGFRDYVAVVRYPHLGVRHYFPVTKHGEYIPLGNTTQVRIQQSRVYQITIVPDIGYILIYYKRAVSGHLFKRVSRRCCLLACYVVRHCKWSAAFGATACQNLAAVLGSHTFTEAVLVDSSAVWGLVCSLHFI